LTPDFCAMSLSDSSIELRSIISSLAATSSFSAVVFLPPGSLFGALVFKCGPMTSEWPACPDERADNPKPARHSRVN
jgi:hypothetical protein